ncbi:MAG: class I SAM-dependent methyltransferase [Acidobacteria bacterium]|nr:class I SAM-dependent methyltransferase [Acidobacteriota bacterium]
MRHLPSFLSVEWGDFQTPPALVAAVIERLGRIGERWGRVLEPTCGTGNFIRGILASGSVPQEIVGIEIQPQYFATAARLQEERPEVHVTVLQRNIFEVDIGAGLPWRTTEPLLVIGNPPWVTNAVISSAGGSNLPAKSNFKGLRGLDAKTGSANFDIAEYIILKVIHDLDGKPATIAMLCKTVVARNILEYASRKNLFLSSVSIMGIDAQEHFGAAVDACLFIFDINQGSAKYEADVFTSLIDEQPATRLGMVGGLLVSDLGRYVDLSFADGESAWIWRSGVKHDASSVFELTRNTDGSLVNKAGTVVDVEPHFVYPLLKSTDVFLGQSLKAPTRALILPQVRLGEDTAKLGGAAPKLWGYLWSHAKALERRKSKIYLGKPRFSVFGVGDYSFAPYKVAISGLHKELRFRCFGPVGGRPVMLDDTCYFAPFQSASEAAFACALMNDSTTRAFLSTLVFMDSKRPVTKRLLQRLDLGALIARCNRELLLNAASVEYKRLTGQDLTLRDWPENLQALLIGETARTPMSEVGVISANL